MVHSGGDCKGTDQEEGGGEESVDEDGEVEHPPEAEETCYKGDDDAGGRRGEQNIATWSTGIAYPTNLYPS